MYYTLLTMLHPKAGGGVKSSILYFAHYTLPQSIVHYALPSLKHSVLHFGVKHSIVSKALIVTSSVKGIVGTMLWRKV